MILLTHNTVPLPFIIDDEDYEKVSQYKWYSGYPNQYPMAKINGGITRLHIFLFGRAPDGLEWDHKNQNKLDNRKDNLQAVIHSVNLENREPSFSEIPGINLNSNHFIVFLPASESPNGKKQYLGRCATIEAAIAQQFLAITMAQEAKEDSLYDKALCGL